ncbi:MAG: hypothetical protein LBL36_06175, partial [Clostridiales Family XIII bacterium]|nr:hypothetical protein [Clostridiales Family XIII bacterium]
ITDGTLHADIPIKTLDKLAKDVINAETVKVTALSTAAGIPGGFAMGATIPADLMQFYGHIIRVAQKLTYIYGWDEIFTDSNELDEATESQLVLFIGVMSGVKAATKAVVKLFGETAMKSVAKKVAAQALTKTWYYPIVKKVATMLGQKIVKDTFAKGVSKTVPLLGGVISGGLTLATFKPMAHKLQKHLSEMAHMSPEEFAEYEAALTVVIDEEELAAVESGEDTTEEAVEEITISKSQFEALMIEMSQLRARMDDQNNVQQQLSQDDKEEQIQ